MLSFFVMLLSIGKILQLIFFYNPHNGLYVYNNHVGFDFNREVLMGAAELPLQHINFFFNQF